MIMRSLIAALTTALLAGSALAAPQLKAEVVVIGAVVTVGDMFDDAGLQAELPLFRAPNPGTTGSVPVAAITAAAARIGIADFEANGLQSVNVIRSASVVDEAVLTDLITRDLVSRGTIGAAVTAQAMFTVPFAPINAEATDAPATLLSLRYLPGNGAFNARFAVAGMAKPLDVSGTLDLSVEAPHLATSLPAGTVISASDIEMRPVSLRNGDTSGFADPAQLVGMQLNRQSREGMLLKPADVSTPTLIARNDLVTIYFRQGPMTLTVKGQAITNAVTGAPVQVLNLMSKRVITATAIAAGAVEVSKDPLALAGL
ncbi:MAG: flgA [Devosia sp.]|uniref:flagellar basal body P-ring formation chaperone FlgA n=1 Tax=Devosia sp. TaxID=1871048 RepID=UPI00262AF499|nr:flagellar basal body P-ring formation chaperone FlgA [Devosia sp.]MDB5527824.1 flgA [Devosia sp.]